MKIFTISLVVLLCVAFGDAKGGSSGGRGSSSGSRGSISSGRGSISKPIAPSRPISPSRPIAPSRPVVIVRSRPIIVPPRPAVVVFYHPPAPRVIIIHTSPRLNLITISPVNRVVIIRARPPTYVPIFVPVYNPYPIYSVIYTTTYYHQEQPKQDPTPQYVIPTSACTKGDKTVYGYCQEQILKRFDPDSLNSTWRTCCSAYAEVDCYVKNAGNWCSPQDSKTLIEHSQNVAKFFDSTICRAVGYTTWDSTCDSISKDPATFSRQYYSSPTSQSAFIALPNAVGTEKSCLDKLRNRPEGDLTQKCLNASLDMWDSGRKKMIDNKVWDTCCAMYDSLDCLQVQAASGDICTESEQEQLANFKKVSAAAFSGGICRSVPYDKADSVCRGEMVQETSKGGALTSLPSISLYLALFVLLVFGQM